MAGSYEGYFDGSLVTTPPTIDASNATMNKTYPQRESLPLGSQIALIVIYSLTTLFSVVGNTMVILVFSLGKKSRSDLKAFLINLAVADLIMAIFCMPFTFTQTMLADWVFSTPMCPIVLYMQTVSVTASVCTNMAIGIDRFWVVMFPLKSRTRRSPATLAILLIWIVALGVSGVQLWVGRAMPVEVEQDVFMYECTEVWPDAVYREVYTFFILVSTYLLPLVILAVTYGCVACKLNARTAPGNRDNARDAHQLQSKRKVCSKGI